ncbi:MAG: hypothetical protein QM484_11500 [Woeseiaceae bacterium]
MTIKYLDKAQNIVTDRGLFLLEELFEVTRSSVEGVDAERFRADHHSDLDLLDTLTNKGFLTDKWDKKKLYRPTLYALPLLKHSRSREILEQSNMIISYLRSRYIEKLSESIEIAKIAYDLSKDYFDITETFLYMDDGHSWSCGHTLPFPFGLGFPNGKSASITTCETTLKSESFDKIINRYYEWYILEQKNKSILSSVIEGLNIKPGAFGINIDLKKVFISIFNRFWK